MLRISKETEYACLLLAELARHNTPQSATYLAARCDLPLPVSSKVLKKMMNAGFLESQRGVGGGYVLRKNKDEMMLADVVEVMEGPVTLVECLETETSNCPRCGQCHFSPLWATLNAGITNMLRSIPLSTVIKDER